MPHVYDFDDLAGINKVWLHTDCNIIDINVKLAQ